MRWDPAQYAVYAEERGRPFADLLARVTPHQDLSRPEPLVVDLGCGPGPLTATLSTRWPKARVVGVDSSAEMIASARALATPRLEFVRADLRNWYPDAPVDVLVSNATLQWVPEHLDLLPRFVSWLRPGGWFAMQVPDNFGEPSHVLLHQLRESPRWRAVVGAAVAPDLSRAAVVADAREYLAVLRRADCTTDVWETTYLHVLHGPDPVLEWMRGTGARPTLEALPEYDRLQFEAEYAALLREAYPAQSYGTVLPFQRIFAVARRDGHS